MNKKLLKWAKDNWLEDAQAWDGNTSNSYRIAPTLAICLLTEAVQELTQVIENKFPKNG
jgi:hypothetical protein